MFPYLSQVTVMKVFLKCVVELILYDSCALPLILPLGTMLKNIETESEFLWDRH